ncbi:MAG: hypothetical protein K2R93_15290 [Gemmatimonadaceae bacterium]|nr:hypothetical protein [Gemmatimonadaceae bacterium]
MSRYDRAQAGGDGKEALRRERMAEAAAEMQPLRTADDALERLDQIGRFAVAGIIAGTSATAAANATRAWAAVHRDVKLAAEVERLKAELKAAKAERPDAPRVVRR